MKIQNEISRNSYKEYLRILKISNLINPFAPNAPFLYLPKTSKNLTVFWYFKELENRCIVNKWVNTNKGTYFIWVIIKSRKAELKRVNVSLARYVGLIRHDGSYNVRFILTNTKPRIFRIRKNQSIQALHRGVLILTFTSQVSQFKLLVRECRKKPLNSSSVG